MTMKLPSLHVNTDRPTTHTSEGPFPAVTYRAHDGKQYFFVVAVNVERRLIESNIRIIPRRDMQGRLVYAVPGGGQFVEGVGML